MTEKIDRDYIKRFSVFAHLMANSCGKDVCIFLYTIGIVDI